MILKFTLFMLLIMLAASQSQNDDNQGEQQRFENYRTKRASKIWGFFETLGSFKNILGDQYTDTKSTLNQLYSILQDGFSDTAIPSPPPPPTIKSTDDRNSSITMPTTTEKYRISRYEAGRILGRNFRGLQNLLKIELNDALNQSQYNVIDYQREIQNAIGPKNITATKVITKRKRKLYKQLPIK